MICFACLQPKSSEEMGSTFLCKCCVDSKPARIDGNITDKELKEVLTRIGAERNTMTVKA